MSHTVNTAFCRKDRWELIMNEIEKDIESQICILHPFPLSSVLFSPAALVSK